MNRTVVQVDLFGFESPVKKLKTGELVDMRHTGDIEPLNRYQVSEVARILDCSETTVYNLIQQLYLATGIKNVDMRHWQDIDESRSYSGMELSRRFNCSHQHIKNLRDKGAFQSRPVRVNKRVPGWSVIDFIKKNASPASAKNQLDYLKVGTLTLVPGWSLIDYIEQNCSRV